MLEITNEFDKTKFSHCEECGSKGVAIPDEEWFFLFNRDIFIPPVFCINKKCRNRWKSKLLKKIKII